MPRGPSPANSLSNKGAQYVFCAINGESLSLIRQKPTISSCFFKTTNSRPVPPFSKYFIASYSQRPGKHRRKKATSCSDSSSCKIVNSPFSNAGTDRSEEHTSELQSRGHLVCR